jgi:hypothetical protein
MAKSRYTFEKHAREKARKQKQEEKAARRLEKKLKENVAGDESDAQALLDEKQDG